MCRSTEPLEWGECSAAIGFAYTEKGGDINSEERENALDKAKSYFGEALEVLTQAEHPLQFAEVQDQVFSRRFHVTMPTVPGQFQLTSGSPPPIRLGRPQLGTLHLERHRGSRPDNLASAIESFQKCLEVYKEAENPQVGIHSLNPHVMATFRCQVMRFLIAYASQSYFTVCDCLM